MAAQVGSGALTSWLSRLTDREQKLVMVTAVVAGVFIIGGAVWWSLGVIDGREKRVKLRRDQLAQIQALEGQYKEAEAEEKRALRRLKTNNTSLFSLLQSKAGKLGLQLNDLNERKLPVKDTEIEEISVEVNLKSLSVDKLNQFLEEIEGRSKSGLVKILKLKVKTRHDNDELLDVNLTVATWKQVS